jgi:hypothetical protein
MEAFFREVTRQDAMPGQDPELWRRHGMRIVGPPPESGQIGSILLDDGARRAWSSLQFLAELATF